MKVDIVKYYVKFSESEVGLHYEKIGKLKYYILWFKFLKINMN